MFPKSKLHFAAEGTHVFSPIAYACLAFILSFIVLHFQYFIGHDGVWYVRMAQNIFAGRGISVNPGEAYIDHPPFYPVLIGVANIFFEDLEFSGHLVSVLAFSLSLIPFFFLVRSIYPGYSAHWASLLFATNGFLLIHSNMVLAESLFVFLLLIQVQRVHQIIQEPKSSVKAGVLFGALAGLTYLTRPEGLLFYAAGALSILLLCPQSFAFRIRVLFFSFFMFLILAVPYLVFVHHHSGKWQMSGAITELFVKRQMDVSFPGGYLEAKKIYQGLTDDKTRLKLDELKENFRLLDYLRKDHFTMVRAGLSSMIWRFLEFNRYFFGGLGFFFVGAAWISVPWNVRRKRTELLFLIFLLTALPQLFGIFHPKRFFLYFPFFLIWMGEGIEVLRHWAQESFHWHPRSSQVLALGTCLFFALPSAGYVAYCVKGTPVPTEYQELGLWMKRNIPHIEEERVASRHPSIIYYSGAKILNPPYLPYVDKWEDLLSYLRHQHAKYFVVSSDLERPTLDAFRVLLKNPAGLPPSIHLLHTVKGRTTVVLFEVINPPPAERTF